MLKNFRKILASLDLRNSVAKFWQLWLALVIFFFVARIFYFFDHDAIGEGVDYKIYDVCLVFLSAFRFDASISALMSFPLLLLVPLANLFGKRFNSIVVSLWGVAVFAVSLGVTLVDHYFYYYFTDHINVFFWEFWDDIENAKLVLAGVSDIVSISKLVWSGLLLAVLAICLLVLVRKLRIPVPFFFQLLLIPLALRGTIDHRPLTIQDRRVSISSHPLLNMIHSNPFFPLHRSYQEIQESYNRDAFKSISVPDQSYELVADFLGAKVGRNDKARWIEKKIAPNWAPYLKRRPKHVVLIVMESYSYWPSESSDGAFNRMILANLDKIKLNALSFENHFSTGKGTLKNLVNIVYGFPQPRNFHPALTYYSDAYRGFPGTLPKVASNLGMQSKFIYAGVQSWHHLGRQMERAGFDQFLAEHSAADLPHHEYGLYDEGFFTLIDRQLQEASSPTFVLGMSQTNHPPFFIPEDFVPSIQHFPEEYSSAVDRVRLGKRFIAYEYSDRALGDYLLKVAPESEYFKDTLFVITADHSFTAGLAFTDAQNWQVERIPFVVYAPDMMKEEYQGKSMMEMTTHFDLLPTITGLTTEKAMTIPVWGRNMLGEQNFSSGAISQYMSCLNANCLIGQKLYQKKHLGPLVPIDDPAELEKLKTLEKAYYYSAIGYLNEF